MGISVAKFILLAVMLLAVHGAQGRLVTICELKNDLEAACKGNNSQAAFPPQGNFSFGNSSLGNQSMENQTMMDLLARIICKVQLASGLNTSLVTRLATSMCNVGNPRPKPTPEEPRKKVKPQRKQREAKKMTHKGENKKPGEHSESSEEEDNHFGPMTPPNPPVNLYGIFQLSDCDACSNGVTPSKNICKIPCSALIDDNITDDIACFKKINGGAMKQPMLPDPCARATYGSFFSSCP